MKIIMRQAHRFIKNGDMPMAMMFFTRRAFSPYMPFFRCNSSLLLVKSFIW